MRNLRRSLTYSAGVHLLAGVLLWSAVLRGRAIRPVRYYAVDFLGGGRPSRASGAGAVDRPLATPTPPHPLVPPKKKPTPQPDSWLTPAQKRPGTTHPSSSVPTPAQATKPQAASQPSPVLSPGPGGFGGGAGGGIGIGFGPGSGVGMGLVNFPYAWYVNTLRAKLWEEWSRWVPPGSRQHCLVTFVIQRDGTISDSQLERSSGDSLFDQGALRTVQTAAPFPPLPEGFQDPSLRVHVEFRLSGT